MLESANGAVPIPANTRRTHMRYEVTSQMRYRRYPWEGRQLHQFHRIVNTALGGNDAAHSFSDAMVIHDCPFLSSPKS